MSLSEFSVVLAFGFVSRLHCVQMCGPIVLTYSVAANTGSARRPMLRLHLCYNAGRTLTYMLIGATLGLAGGAVGFVGRLAGIENLAAMVAGIAMIVAGLIFLGLRSGIQSWRGMAMPARLLRPVGKLLSSRSAGSKFLLGMLMGLLPCGLIYAALIRAIGTGTPLGGALTLLAYKARELTFCCMGCANVYAILLESGVIASGKNTRETELFRRSLELGLISNAEAMPVRRIDIDPQAPTEEMLLQVGGMWFSACGWLIEHALRALPGVIAADVFFASDLAKVKYCPQYLPPDTIAARIVKLGYQATEYGAEGSDAKSETRDQTLRLGVAAFLRANIMAFSTILYVGYFEQIAASASRVLPFVLWALTTPLVFYCAWPILRAAVFGLANRQIRMETLLALGILSAYLLSAARAMRGQTHVYFDTAAAIVTLVLAGKLIERAAKDRAARSIGMLYRLMPKKVRILNAGVERSVSIDALESGQVFVVKAGERIPADGVVIEGVTHTDESLLTGEAAPVSKRPGDPVVSGNLNAGGVIHVGATRTGDASALAQIIRFVERALSTRAPIERTVDRVARIFVPAVVLLAMAQFVVLLAMHQAMAIAVQRATTILVIACPCALGLATPLAIAAAVGSASQSGLLVSDSGVFETLGSINAVVLDKTGTVTRGEFRLTDFALLRARVQALAMAACGSGDASTLAAAEAGDQGSAQFVADILPVLAGVESFSEHLLGRAIVH